MTLFDCTGYTASALVVVTFYMKDMVHLRIAALCSNVAFLIYGIGLRLGPVALLHGALIPLNLWRLLTALSVRARVNDQSTAGERRSPV